MARRYIIVTRIDKMDPEDPENKLKTYYRYIGENGYAFNRSVILDKTHTRILKGFQEILRHGFRSLKSTEEYLESKVRADEEFTDGGLYRKTSNIESFYFVPRY